MGSIKKVTDKELWAALEANSGLLSRTARALEKKLGITYTRQAVKERAEKDMERLNDIREQQIDIAEDSLIKLIRSEDERVRFQAVKYYLSTIGKKRGYVERRELDHNLGTLELTEKQQEEVNEVLAREGIISLKDTKDE